MTPAGRGDRRRQWSACSRCAAPGDPWNAAVFELLDCDLEEPEAGENLDAIVAPALRSALERG